jgi:hypothetical protein
VITEPLDLMVAGGPTQAFSMTRPSTREDAVRAAASHGSKAVGVGEGSGIRAKGTHSELVATFDTRWPGSAISRVRLPLGAAKFAHNFGYAAAAKPESLYVEDVTGTLLEGELDRARPGVDGWGLRAGDRPVERPGDEGVCRPCDRAIRRAASEMPSSPTGVPPERRCR